MKLIYLFFLALIIFLSCSLDDSTLSQKDVEIEYIESRALPENTLEIIDFDRVLLESENKIELVNIEDPNNLEIIFEAPIPSGKQYKSIFLERFLKFSGQQGTNSQFIVDMFTGNTFELSDSISIRSINPIDQSILYTVTSFRPEIGMPLRRLYVTTFDGLSKFVTDSVNWAEWSPDGNWILLSKYSYKDDQRWYWKKKMINLSGKEFILLDESVSPLLPIWTEDGSYALFRISHGEYRVTILQFDWSKKEQIIKHVASSDYYIYDPVWSPDGRLIVFSEEISDGHYLFGTDILLSDRNLGLKKTIIAHDDVVEYPIDWTIEHGLITQIEDSLYRYEINY